MNALSAGQCYRLERRVEAFVGAERVLGAHERLLLLLSGGADSMALLALMLVLGRRQRVGALAALHVDYGLRGEDSDRDRKLVEAVCERYGVPLQVLRCAPEQVAGSGLQERARRLRYERARRLLADEGYDAIVTAHNRDDQAETILYRLIKYTSSRSVVGMRPRDGLLARPLLCLGGDEIRAYCAGRGIAYRIDASNEGVAYARNRLRRQAMPLLGEINPRVAETLAATATEAAAEQQLLDELAAELLAAARVDDATDEDVVATLDLRALRAAPQVLARRALHAWLQDALGGSALVGRRQVAAAVRLLDGDDGGRRLSLRRDLEVVRGGGRLSLRRRRVHECAPALVDLGAPGLGAGASASFCGRRLRCEVLAGALLPATQSPGSVVLGFAAPPKALILRHPLPGELFAPAGLGHRPRLAQHLAAAHVSAERRRRALVAEVDGEAAWVGFADAGGLHGRVAAGRLVDDSSRWTLRLSEEDVCTKRSPKSS